MVSFMVSSAAFLSVCVCIRTCRRRQRNSRQERQQSLQVYTTDVSIWLNSFGLTLKCPDHYRSEGNRLAQKLFDTLRCLAHYSVGKVYIVGSFGKKTDVIMPDLDLTFVVNHEKPPFTKVLNDIENVIRENYKFLEVNLHQGCKKSDRSFQFQFKNGIDVDLLPAADFPDEEIKAKIREEPEGNSRIFSSSLAGKQKAFMTSQDGYTHTLVRLAKFWFKSLHFEEKMHGGSAMIEVIATAAAIKSDSRCIIIGWITFMRLMLGLDTLKIAFEEVEKNVWVLISESSLSKQNLNNLVPKVIGERKMLNRKCFVIDPINPCEDYLFDQKAFIGKLKMYANVTSQRFHSLFQKRTAIPENFIETLFKPQPQNLMNLYPKADARQVVLTCCNPYQSMFGKLQVRNEKLFENVKIKRLVEALRSNLVSVVHTYFNNEANALEGKSVQTILENLENKVECQIRNNLQVDADEILTMSHMHKEMDVKILVPYKIRDNIYAVRLSLGW